MTLFGSAWAVTPAGILGATPVATALTFSFVGLIAVGLVIGCVLLMRLAQRLTVDTSPEGVARSRAIGKRLGLGFGVVFGSEVVLIALAAGLPEHGQLADFILPVIVLTIALHFLPLA